MGRRVALFAVLAVLLWQPSRAGVVEIPFELNESRGAILLHGQVRGKDAVLLLDTGSAYTIVDAALLGVSPMDLKLARLHGSGPGLSGEALWAEASLRVGPKTWPGRRLVVMNLDHLSKIYGRRIGGILGHDLLLEFHRVTIDFQSRRLILSR